MNILLTGATRAHMNSYKIRPKTNILQPNKLIYDILLDLGHTVEWRPVTVGETLDGIDVVFCIFSPVNSPGGRKSLSMLWAIYQAKERNIPIIYYFEDWNYYAGFSNMSSFGNSSVERVHRKFGHQYFFEDLEDVDRLGVLDELQSLARDFITPESVYASRGVSLVTVFSNLGDRKVITETMRNKQPVMDFDYTPLVLSLASARPIQYEARKEAWILPGLHLHDSWTSKLDNQWDIEYLGQRKKAKRVNEHEVSDEMVKYRGTLSPEYYNAGGGWHRMRFIYAAQTETYIWPGKTDAEMYLSNENYIISPGEFEQLSDSGQESVASYVAGVIREHLVTDPQKPVNDIRNALNEAIRKA